MKRDKINAVLDILIGFFAILCLVSFLAFITIKLSKKEVKKEFTTDPLNEFKIK